MRIIEIDGLPVHPDHPDVVMKKLLTPNTVVSMIACRIPNHCRISFDDKNNRIFLSMTKQKKHPLIHQSEIQCMIILTGVANKKRLYM
eukprot:UN21384